MKNSLLTDIRNHIEGKHAVLFWSGGYDSTFLYNLFIKNRLYNVADLSIVIIRCPQEIYDGKRVKKALDFLSLLPVRVYCFEPQEEIAADIEFSKACSVCKRIRRTAILKALEDIRSKATDGKEILLVTGHNLDDLASYYLENVTYGLDKNSDKYRERFIETANKLFPVFDYGDNLKIYRPLIKFTKKQMLEIFSDSENAELTLCNKKCRWLRQRKRLLQEYLSATDVRLDYNLIEKNFKSRFVMPTDDEFKSLPVVTYLL